ncbi:hypothetical protein DSO57_1024977 [Entomophthora muscae]|uniref:Uncharacterized protein n=1 Tax=Entomophthora muscae TaxID=34485 RepID=A0ACC2TPP8_9FUNG|nr:hypothetical protein DSO57_1024977 [Entomophthora muscae]
MQTSTTNVQISAAIKQIHTATMQKPAVNMQAPTTTMWGPATTKQIHTCDGPHVWWFAGGANVCQAKVWLFVVGRGLVGNYGY